jgi:hypothetical protein
MYCVSRGLAIDLLAVRGLSPDSNKTYCFWKLFWIETGQNIINFIFVIIIVTRKQKIVGLERGPLSLVSTTEELLDRKVAAPV